MAQLYYLGTSDRRLHTWPVSHLYVTRHWQRRGSAVRVVWRRRYREKSVHQAGIKSQPLNLQSTAVRAEQLLNFIHRQTIMIHYLYRCTVHFVVYLSNTPTNACIQGVAIKKPDCFYYSFPATSMTKRRVGHWPVDFPLSSHKGSFTRIG